ncbi:MAG: thioesterase family protein [bacterium]|nr:thioesterase family protein [bacterium]
MDEQRTKLILTILKNAYENQMPFNKLLGLKMKTLTMEKVEISFDMKDELVGNFEKRILHGGVISSVLDFTGGAIAQMHVLEEMKESPPEEIARRLTQMGTIDLRIDYIRPGRGDSFTASGHILRLGNKVAVARTELRNNEDILIAAGTGTILVG